MASMFVGLNYFAQGICIISLFMKWCGTTLLLLSLKTNFCAREKILHCKVASIDVAETIPTAFLYNCTSQEVTQRREQVVPFVLLVYAYHTHSSETETMCGSLGYEEIV